MHYQIFIPHNQQSPIENTLPARLALAGLSDHVEDAMTVPCPAGPEDTAGLLVGWLDAARGNLRLEYRPDEQTWLRSVPCDDRASGAYWVGIWNDRPPTEGDLRRPHTRCGRWVEFGDEKWKLPTPDTVEKTAVYNDDGSMKWAPMRSYAWLCDEAEKLRNEYIKDWRSREMEFAFDPSEFVNWMLRLLRVNYHMTPEVAAHLQMWRDTQIADAVIQSLGLQRKGEADG